MIKIACISDTHAQHNKVIVPECDILIHAGDFSRVGSLTDTKSFLEWFSKQPAQYKICISGNHDYLDEKEPALFKELLKEYPGVIYLRDEGCEVLGLKFWGRPITPEFCAWAFMADPQSPKMLSSLSIIPADIDVLITHGPAFNILDKTLTGQNVGCKDLLNELPRLTNLRYLICGHIHHSVGTQQVGNTLHVNAAVLNDHYEFKNQPILIEVP